jgi:transcriptional regulator with XRE-family HTH domain
MVDKKTIAKNIGANLKRLREGKGLTMQALANLAEVEKSQIVRIENGQVDAKVSSLYILAHALQVEIGEFFLPI